MESLNQIGSRIMNYLRGGFQIDDNRIDWELVYDLVHEQRAVVVNEDYKTKRRVDSQLYQEVCCLPVTCVPVICNGPDSGARNFEIQLPDLMDIEGRPKIAYLGVVDDHSQHEKPIEFSEMTVQGTRLKKSLLYGKRMPSYTRIGTTAYLMDPPTQALKFACIVAVLDNPLGSGCTRLLETDPYPLPRRFINLVEYLSLEKLLGMLNLDPDQLNNARDDLRTAYNQHRSSNRGKR